MRGLATAFVCSCSLVAHREFDEGNGQIYRTDWFRTIPPASEVFILPRMTNG